MRTMKAGTLLLLMFIFPLLWACAGSAKQENQETIESRNWLIFGKNQAEEMGLDRWLVEADGFWTPTGEDIFTLEENIAEFLSQNAAAFYRQPPVWERLDEYRRQYVGIERAGKLLIYGNFFCNSAGVDWRENLVSIEDGGECYFQVEYNVDSGMFIMLLVNGEA